MQCLLTRLLLIGLFAIFFNTSNAQSARTYSIDSVKFNSDGSNDWQFYPDSLAGNLVSVDIHNDKIEIFQYPSRVFKIVGFNDPNPVKEADGDTFIFKCMDNKYKTCSIYVAFTYKDREHPTMFIQYKGSNEMYYLKNF
jgi:hypothetical protein